MDDHRTVRRRARLAPRILYVDSSAASPPEDLGDLAAGIRRMLPGVSTRPHAVERFLEPRSDRSRPILAVARRSDGEIAGFASASVLPVPSVGPVLHLRLVCVRDEHRGGSLGLRLATRLVRSYLLRHRRVGRLWCTHVSADLAGLGLASHLFDGVYPSPDGPGRPRRRHLAIAHHVERELREELFLDPRPASSPPPSSSGGARTRGTLPLRARAGTRSTTASTRRSCPRRGRGDAPGRVRDPPDHPPARHPAGAQLRRGPASPLPVGLRGLKARLAPSAYRPAPSSGLDHLRTRRTGSGASEEPLHPGLDDRPDREALGHRKTGVHQIESSALERVDTGIQRERLREQSLTLVVSTLGELETGGLEMKTSFVRLDRLGPAGRSSLSARATPTPPSVRKSPPSLASLAATRIAFPRLNTVTSRFVAWSRTE